MSTTMSKLYRIPIPCFQARLLCVIALLAVTSGVVLAQPSASFSPELEVHYIDVGTGDCIWIRTGNDGDDTNNVYKGLNIIIDGGDWGGFGRIDGYAFASSYFQEEVNGAARLALGSRIDWMILTHPHSDHNGGLYGILNDYDVANIIDPGHDKTNEEGVPDRLRPKSAYGRFFQAASTEVLATGEKANFYWGVPDDLTLDWGEELSAEILWSSREIVGGDMNNTSIVLRLGFTGAGNDASFLFMGDAERHVEEHLVSTLGSKLRSSVLKVGHHGSNSSTTINFLKAVRPEHAVITAGNHAFSGTLLPRSETLTRINQVSQELGLATKIWRTDRDDKSPIKPVGTEGGDDTIVARTRGKTIAIDYVSTVSKPELDPVRCQAITQKGEQCKRQRSGDGRFCWQHAGASVP